MTLRRQSGISRRGFLAGGMAAAAAPLVLAPRQVLGAAESTPPSERLNIAGIGIGGMGGHNIRNLAAANNVVALCDVDWKLAEPVFNSFPEARKYKDFREMLAAEKDLDGVVVATPDHSHAVIAAAVMRAGLPVFCQKPLTHTVYEARELARIAKETGVVTQMGIQGHAGEGTWTLCNWIAKGVIGEIREVETYCTDSYYPWGHASWSPPQGTLPTEEVPVPEGFDWDLWLGPAQPHLYHPNYHPQKWRAFLDFGSGWTADRGVHTLDPVVYALGLGAPERIDATVTGLDQHMHPVSEAIVYEFGKRKGKPPVTVKWYTGLRCPRPRGAAPDDMLGDGTGGMVFIGEDGILTADTYGQNPRFLPGSKMKDFNPPAPAEPWPGRAIEEDWVWAIKNGKKACADFSYSGPVTEITCLGNIAKRVDGCIEWDSENMRITNNEDANKYLRTQYRDGWSL